jgi:16S rRNA (guanine966-N2)-methyltransferase
MSPVPRSHARREHQTLTDTRRDPSPCHFRVHVLSSDIRRGWSVLMKTQIRIVAGSLRGRKLTCTVNVNLRPTPQMVREALFSILGNAVPDRPFFDVFAGTGVIGLEGLSRGASSVTFVERDVRLIGELERHIEEFGVGASARIVRGDVYRWIERWQPPAEPVNVFLSPPFADFGRRLDEMLAVMAQIQGKIHTNSVLILQAETTAVLDEVARNGDWDIRRYGRNELWFWVKEAAGEDHHESNE